MSGFARDSVALVTGAGSGIGRALVEELAARGARVVVSDRDGEAAAAVAERIRAAGGRAQAAVLDVTDAERFRELADELVAEHGRLDLLVNNAGIGLAGEVRDMELADWTPLVDVNLWGVIHGIHAVYPHMVRQGAGHIVNIASGAGLLPRPGMAAYAATKHAVQGLSVSLRAEAAPLGVRVSSVCPGFIGTAIMSSTRYLRLDGAALAAEVPLKPVPPEVCARAILRGVARNRAVIPVSALTRLEWLLYRWWPGLGRRLADWRFARMRAHRSSSDLRARCGSFSAQ